MKNLDECKIREALKSIYDLFDDDCVYDFIFTTFDFDKDFFVENIVSYLMGSDRKISTVAELEAANEWIKNNRISVYYDHRALKSSDSKITLTCFPRDIEKGVFHPKVIIIYGKLKNDKNDSVYLIVSSCNLTVSGYGRNKEAFACIKVESESVAKSLLAFIKRISSDDNNRHEKLKEFLDSNKFNKKKDVEFLWSYVDGEKGISLIDKISELPEGDLIIISPFFDREGPGKLLKKIKNNKNHKTTIYPAIYNEFYGISKTTYDDLKEDVNFKSLCIGGIDNKGFVHAKIIIKGNYCCVGSYNFTTHALEQMNAEAALLFNNVDGLKLKSKSIDESLFPSDNNDINNMDENSKMDCDIFVSVTVDWEEDKMYISAKNLKENKKYIMQIDGSNCEIQIENIENEVKLDDEIKDILLLHKQFSIWEKVDDRKIRICLGLINEINCESRREIGYESLDEMIMALQPNNNDLDKESIYDLKCINTDDKEIATNIDKVESKIDIFDNYYLVSTSFENMKSEVISNNDKMNNYIKEVEKKSNAKKKTKKYLELLESIKKIEKILYDCLATRRNSIERFLEFVNGKLESGTEIDEIYYWLILKYIGEILNCFQGIKSNNKKYPISKKTKELLDIHNKCESKLNRIIKSKLKENEKNGAKYLKWIEKELKMNYLTKKGV